MFVEKLPMVLAHLHTQAGMQSLWKHVSSGGQIQENVALCWLDVQVDHLFADMF